MNNNIEIKKEILDILNIADLLEENDIKGYKSIREDVDKILKKDMNSYQDLVDIEEIVMGLYEFIDILNEYDFKNHEEIAKNSLSSSLKKIKEKKDELKEKISYESVAIVQKWLESLNSLIKITNEIDMETDFYTENVHIGIALYKSDHGNIPLRYTITIRTIDITPKYEEVEEKGICGIDTDKVIEKLKNILNIS